MTGKPVSNTRLIYLDVLRGLMLVIITFDHLAGPIKSITFEPLGFVSAAEGFIFLSGFVYGLVYTRFYKNGGLSAILVKSGKRAGVIYFYHWLVLIIVFGCSLLNLCEFRELTLFKYQPLKSVTFFSLFLLQPHNMDILPMYVIFVLSGPFLLRAVDSGRTKTVLAISITLWLISQSTVLQYNKYDLQSSGFHFGYFNILSWQLLFITGLFFGHNRSSSRYSIPTSISLTVVAITGLLIFAIARYSPHDSLLFRLISHFSQRETLGASKVINFGLMAYLVFFITKGKGNNIRLRWLAFLGRHSLQVFAYSVCLVSFVLPVKSDVWDLHIITEVIFDILLVATLTLPAWLHQTIIRKVPLVKQMGL